jgi:hypothetical protein
MNFYRTNKYVDSRELGKNLHILLNIISFPEHRAQGYQGLRESNKTSTAAG